MIQCKPPGGLYMLYTENEILAFLNGSLPHDVLQSLMDTVEAYGVYKGAMLYEDVKLLERLLLIRELRFINALSGKDCSHEDILLALSFKDEENELQKQADAYEKCKAYIAGKLPLYRIIPATDLLRIDHFIKNHIPDILSDRFFTDAYDDLAKVINDDILRILYGLNNKHHMFIRMIAAYHLFDVKLPEYKLNMLALDILFSTLAHSEQKLPQATIWLAKYTLLNADWGYVSPNRSFETTVIKLLTYFRDEFESLCLLIHNKQNKSDDLTHRLQHILPQSYSESLTGLIRSNLCLRNNDFIDALYVTPMTTIKYAKILEREQIITGFKHGREKIYINREIISLIQD